MQVHAPAILKTLALVEVTETVSLRKKWMFMGMGH